MRTLAIIQARMGSTRLSGKVMKELSGKTVLEHVIERVKLAQSIDDIVIATTVHDRDDVIEKEALRVGAKVFRGSEEDVLSRYYLAAKEYGADIIVRITSDCPLIDPKVIDQVVNHFTSHAYDIVSNASNDVSGRTYPRGLDTEVFTFATLYAAYQNATEKHQREHVTPYIYENTENKYFYKNNKDYSKYRWTLDTEEDWQLISQIYEYLYKGTHDFFFEDIVRVMEKHPELYKINKDIEQKKIKG